MLYTYMDHSCTHSFTRAVVLVTYRTNVIEVTLLLTLPFLLRHRDLQGFSACAPVHPVLYHLVASSPRPRIICCFLIYPGHSLLDERQPLSLFFPNVRLLLLASLTSPVVTVAFSSGFFHQFSLTTFSINSLQLRLSFAFTLHSPLAVRIILSSIFVS